MFNARMTSYSNVRFNFIGTGIKAFLIFFIYPILTLLTAYTTVPFLSRANQKFIINNYRLGTAEFHFDSSVGPFYIAFLISLAWIVVVGGLSITITGFNFLEFAHAMENLEHDPTGAMSLIGMFYLLFFVALMPAAMIYFAMIRNIVFNATTLTGGHRFNSTVSPGMLLWLALSNFVVVLCTVGLMIPWAQVRMSKYLAENTALIPAGSLDDFIGTQQSETSAFGDAFTDLESIDVGLPI